MLTVSKPVNTEEIVNFDPSSRFIKLPIENYLKLVNFNGRNAYAEINRPQIALINAINDPQYRFVVAAFARRLGKTFIANIIGQLVVLVPNTNVLIISPNFSLSSISFDIQRQLIRNFDLEVTRDNAKDKIVELANGSTIRMGSLSTVDSVVGRSYDLIIFDEAALGKDGEEAFNINLRPTLDKINSKAIFISTPRGKGNWFSVFHARGFDPAYAEWISMTADYTENHRVSSRDIEEARKSMSKAEFEQEYMASFTSFEGQIYGFKSTHIKEFSRGIDKVEIFAGLDPGYRDPTAFIVIAYYPSSGVYWVIDEYLEAEAVTAKHARVFREKMDKWGIDPIFIDSAAAQFASDLAYTYEIATINARKQVLEGIAYVQTIVDQGRLYVDPSCIHTLEMLDQYQWDKRENLIKEKPLHDKYSHMADALRYAIYSYIV
jgi:hypothetical protein